MAHKSSEIFIAMPLIQASLVWYEYAVSVKSVVNWLIRCLEVELLIKYL